MLYICHIANDKANFVVYDKKEFKPEDFNLEPVKEITIDELKSEYSLFPLIKLDEFLLRILAHKKRTINNILAEQGIETFRALEHEYGLINLKQSKLSHSQREFVCKRYEEIINT